MQNSISTPLARATVALGRRRVQGVKPRLSCGFTGTAAVGPASAADGYRSVDAVVAGGASSDGYRSVDAVIAANGTPQQSGERAGGAGYVDALLRSPAPPQSQPEGVATARGGEGFHWDDALIGALMTSILLLVMLAAARTVARHRRASAESRA